MQINFADAGAPSNIAASCSASGEPLNSQPTPIPKIHADKATWQRIVAEYQQPSTARALWQVANTLVPYAALWVLMYFSLKVSWWLTMPVAILAGAFLVRIFIIFHDCGHGSFFPSKRANDVLGFITGVLTFTPYYQWRWEHAIHHGTTGHLDKRGTGDVWTMTIQEYIDAPWWKRWSYRLMRNPFFLLLIAPFFLFVVLQRIPSTQGRRERRSVWWMNLAVALFVAAMCWIFGIKAYLFAQLIVTMTAGAGGVWMFYVQHQFEDAYWERGDDWDYTAAALQGSSFYKLPAVLQWFSGNIGFHHIHHLSPRIPNYNLQRCHDADPIFRQIMPITFGSSLKTLALRLWDEEAKKLTGYRKMRQRRKKQRDDLEKRETKR
ncbi:MAG: fatty acid desaturase [Xanthomonadaceae bacterium]|nr:fatty acid desaturase [Xanthomonadaceae bacterium]